MARWLTHTGPELLEPTKMIYEIDMSKDIVEEIVPIYGSNASIYSVNIAEQDKKDIMKLIDMNYDVILKFINFDNTSDFYPSVPLHFIYCGTASANADPKDYTKDRNNLFYIFDNQVLAYNILSAELRQDGTFVVFPGV